MAVMGDTQLWSLILKGLGGSALAGLAVSLGLFMFRFFERVLTTTETKEAELNKTKVYIDEKIKEYIDELKEQIMFRDQQIVLTREELESIRNAERRCQERVHGIEMYLASQGFTIPSSVRDAIESPNSGSGDMPSV